MFIKKMIFNHRFILAGLILTMLPIVATSQVNVIHLVDNKTVSDKEGIIYSLPRTVINVSLVVDKVQKTKGPYAEFADKYLGITNIITDNTSEYVLREISLTTTTEPDPEQFYFVELDDKSSKKNKLIEMYLSEAGFLQDATDNLKPKNHHIASSNNQQESGNEFADILKPSYFEREDTVNRKESMDTTTIEQKVFRKITSNKNAEQKAKDAADIIIELDEDKLDLLSGEQEVGYGSNLEYMCNQLEAMKGGYLALFKGITSVITTTIKYSIVPKSGETEQDITLCNFSKMKGAVEKSAAEGDPVTIVFESQKLTKTISDLVKSNNSGDKRLHGFSYRIPDNAKISVKVGGQTRLEALFSVNQLGIISSVPAGKISSLRLHPTTGSIKRVILK